MTKKGALIEIAHDHTLLCDVRSLLSLKIIGRISLSSSSPSSSSSTLWKMRRFHFHSPPRAPAWWWSHSTFNTITHWTSTTTEFQRRVCLAMINDIQYTHASLPGFPIFFFFCALKFDKKTKKFSCFFSFSLGRPSINFVCWSECSCNAPRHRHYYSSAIFMFGTLLCGYLCV